MTKTAVRTSEKKLWAANNNSACASHYLLVHLPPCVQPRLDMKFRHRSFSFFLNVDAALTIRTLTTLPTTTRTGLINGDKLWKCANSLCSRGPSSSASDRPKCDYFSAHICESNHKGSFARSGPYTSTLEECNFTVYAIRKMGVFHASRKSVAAPPPKSSPHRKQWKIIKLSHQKSGCGRLR